MTIEQAINTAIVNCDNYEEWWEIAQNYMDKKEAKNRWTDYCQAQFYEYHEAD